MPSHSGEGEPSPFSLTIDPMTHPDVRLVLDTNTVLALWMFRDPVLAALRDWIERSRPPLLACTDTLGELRAVLGYAQFGQGLEAREALLSAYRGRIREIAMPPAPTLPACKDPDDQKFLELAVGAGATHLLTRDRALLKMARRRGISGLLAIVTPEAFSRQLAP